MKSKRHSFKKIEFKKKERAPLEPLFKKQKLITALSVLLVVLITMTGSFAAFTKTSEGNEYNVVQVGELELSYVDLNDEGNVLQLADSYPISDTDGESSTPYRFSVENTGTIIADYTVKIVDDTDTIEADGCSDNLLDKTYIRYKFDNETSQNLIDKKDATTNEYVIYSGTLEPFESNIHEIRLWINENSPNSILGTHYHGKVVIEVTQNNATDPYERPVRTTKIGGVDVEVKETPLNMFNYTSEGVDPMGGESVEPTNGIYAMEDDDGLSYYYRGEVNNLVKFGSYIKDYFVYRYSNYDFPSLEACQYYNSSCSESNKVLKYAASDNVPMYWRIVRINGDGTIRMIYAGTTPDTTGYDTGIGLSRYNEEYNDPKYAGYTYDRTTNETKSDAKTEIDNWYSNVLEGTTYDNDIATGKFCSDSSGYEYDEVATQMFGSEAYTYGGFRRNFANIFGRGNANPSFKCSNEMDENIGGSYSLKAGLITVDEIVAAGGQAEENNSYYLYNGTKGNNIGKWFWSMSPDVFYHGLARVDNMLGDGVAGDANVDYSNGLLRPVINLRSDISFKSGTDGSTTSPYEIN